MITWDLPNNVATVRQIIKNNPIRCAWATVETDHVFLPHALVELGLFNSTSDLKRKRPELWRNIAFPTLCNVGKINLVVTRI